MDIRAQGEKLIELGVPALAGMSAEAFRGDIAKVKVTGEKPLLVVGPALLPASRLAPLLQRAGKPGFVVTDMTDLDGFHALPDLDVPSAGLYTIEKVERGDELLNWSPAEAMPELLGRGRRPLSINEGISWLLQDPAQLEPGKCFMTIASRKPARSGKGLDARTPAIWISGGTGRDGKENKNTTKVGWCWHNNRHTWLGFASCAKG
ncbi:hypothetical protein COCCU_00595 [Corynebacterium occultum]|uniref:Uncharacterized protein n=1 Tax=Corynebacterium occultum TaxID=2675219 RepID=A0A6B8W247_9CORY|nr:DUF5701 family protein [Corynebacterium occultum]QGU06087.1 hypothetical protein COCCU_00595 [Corynebacterium occultum]